MSCFMMTEPKLHRNLIIWTKICLFFIKLECFNPPGKLKKIPFAVIKVGVVEAKWHTNTKEEEKSNSPSISCLDIRTQDVI